MYVDIIILILLLIAVVFVFKRFSSFVYAVALIDIFLRIVDFVARHLPIQGVTDYLDKYFPSSISYMIDKYTNGIVEDILMWGFVGLYVCFWFYVASYFVNKRK